MSENILAPTAIDTALGPAEIVGVVFVTARAVPTLVLPEGKGTVRAEAARWTGDEYLAQAYVRLVEAINGKTYPPLWELQLRCAPSQTGTDRWVGRLWLSRLRLTPAGSFVGGQQLSLIRELFPTIIAKRDPSARVV